MNLSDVDEVVELTTAEFLNHADIFTFSFFLLFFSQSSSDTFFPSASVQGHHSPHISILAQVLSRMSYDALNKYLYRYR